MKTKFKPHYEVIEILNKPGRFAILSQYVDGGAISHDSNPGPNDNPSQGLGYASFEEAMAKIPHSKPATP